jgi:multiple sugar transport system permease protein
MENRRAVFFFLAPALAAIGVFFVLPVAAAFLLSFSDFDIYALGDFRYARFIGVKNYLHLLQDPLFWKALKNTAYFLVVGGPLSIAVSLGSALMLQPKLLRFKGFFRTSYFAPVVTTLVAVAIDWRFVYHPRFGILNYALTLVGLQGVDWLGDPVWAMPAIIVMAVWKNFGYNMIIFVAGLQAIPQMYYEAAKIDGASGRQRFRHVTLPLLSPTLYFVSIMTVIGYFQFFAEPYVMTAGGPLNSTMSIVLYMYNHGFKFYNLGYASAIAFILFAFISLFTLGQSRLSRRLQAH